MKALVTTPPEAKAENNKGERIMKEYFTALIFLCVCACGADPITTKEREEVTSEYECNVTVNLVPSTFNGQPVSPEGTGRGIGKGSTKQEALTEAYKIACGQLDLDNSARAQCERGEIFKVRSPQSSPDAPVISIASRINNAGRLILNGVEVTPHEMFAFYSASEFKWQCR